MKSPTHPLLPYSRELNPPEGRVDRGSLAMISRLVELIDGDQYQAGLQVSSQVTHKHLLPTGTRKSTGEEVRLLGPSTRRARIKAIQGVIIITKRAWVH